MGEKWSDSRPAEKLLTFYTMLLFSRNPISLSEVAESLDCSKQTVGRLADQLESSRYGKVNKFKIGKEVYYSMDKPRRIPAINLNAEALTDLALCYQFIQKLLPPAMLRKNLQSLTQAASYLPEPERSIKDGLGASLAKGPIDYGPYEEILRSFIIAISEQRICVVTYKAKRYQEEKSYYFAPKRLIAFHESIFVSGYIVSDNSPPAPLYEAPNLLAIHRFKSCMLEKRKSTNIPDPPLQNELFLGIFHEKEFPIKVRFHAAAATYVAERKWSARQSIEDLPDNGIVLNAYAGNEKECLSWILSFGEKAELLEPSWMREKIRTVIDAMRQNYIGEDKKE